MASSNQQPLFAAVTKLLRPLAQILLRNGIPYRTFANLAKRVCVDVAAENDFKDSNDVPISAAEYIADVRIDLIAGVAGMLSGGNVVDAAGAELGDQ